MPVDWDQVEDFYTEQPVGSSTHFHENEKFVSVSTLGGSPVSPPTRTVKSNPNEYDGDNYTKESSTVVSGGFNEERLTSVKPSAVDENDQRFASINSQPPAIVKPDHGPE
jgi:hypothetical protein